jgi:hypothetical protein
MDLSRVQQGVKNLGGVISRNSPAILTGLGCAGVLTTAILTGRATLRASEILKMEAPDEQLPATEIVKLTWKVFIPPVLVGASSIACIIGANTINTHRNAALAALYSLSETAFREYKEKVVEEIGRNKELKVRDSIAQDRVTTNPVGDRTIIFTGNGEVLCYDALCDRYFKSSAEKIRQQVLKLNEDLRNDMWLDLNDLYYAIGLPSTKLGNQVGFDMDKGYIQVDYTGTLTPEGQPCLSIDMTVYPKHMW